VRVVTFKVDERLLEELDRYASKSGLSRSDVIRRAIQSMLRQANKGAIIRYRVRRIVLT